MNIREEYESEKLFLRHHSQILKKKGDQEGFWIIFLLIIKKKLLFENDQVSEELIETRNFFLTNPIEEFQLHWLEHGNVMIEQNVKHSLIQCLPICWVKDD